MHGVAGFIEDLSMGAINGLRHRLSARVAVSSPETPASEFAIGTVKEGGETLRVADEDLRRHVYAIGATGSGKTNLLLRLIDHDVTRGRSVVVLDLRGDLIDRTLGRLAAREDADELAGRLTLLDLRDESRVVGVNLLAGAGDPHTRAFQLLSVIRQHADSWGVQLEETLRNSLVALATAGLTALEIEPLLMDRAVRKSVLDSCTDEYALSFFNRYESLSDEKRLSWVMPVLNKVTPLLAIPRLRLAFGSPRLLDLAGVLNQRGSILLVALAVDRLHAAAYLAGGLLVSAIQNAVMARVDLPEKDRVPGTLYVDEFETMASDSFAQILAEGRRFGLALTLSHQNLTQLSPGLRQVLRNNARTQLYFQTGASDASDLAGELSTAFSRDELKSQLVGLQTGEAYVVRRGHPSLLVRTEHQADPNVDPARVAALRSRALGRCSVSREDALRGIAERQAALRREPAAKAKEVRHVRKPGGSRAR